MKRLILLFVSVISTLLTFSQSQPGNLDIGLFNNGANGSNSGSGANLEIALRRVNPYLAIPVAEDFIFLLKAPASSFSKTDVITLVQHNTSLYTPTGSMITQPPVNLEDLAAVDDGFVYFPIVLQSTGIGVNLNPLTTNWSFAFTFSFSPAKTPSQLQSLRIVDQTNNSALAAALVALGAPLSDTYTRVLIGGVNQLSNSSFTILPVTFSNYDVKCNDKGALIKWSTATEQNSDRFEIQRSTNGNDWVTIDNVAAAGNSSSDKNYQYLDIYGGTAFYRIRQVDVDGRFTYTAIKTTNCKAGQFDVTLYPVPAKDKLNIVVQSDKELKTDLQVLDMTGKIVQRTIIQINKGNNNIVLDINNLPGGQYLLVSSDPAVLINKKFTIVR